MTAFRLSCGRSASGSVSWRRGRRVGHTASGEWTSRPLLIGARLLQWLAGPLYPHLATTAIEVVAGLLVGVLCGSLAGLLLGRSPVLAVVLRPIIVAFYSVPLVALAPLFIMFFGLDILPKLILVSIVVFFLMFFNTFAGAGQVDDDQTRSGPPDGLDTAREFPESRCARLHGLDHRRDPDRSAVRFGGRDNRRDAGGTPRHRVSAERRRKSVRHDRPVCGAGHSDVARSRQYRKRPAGWSGDC